MFIIIITFFFFLLVYYFTLFRDMSARDRVEFAAPLVGNSFAEI